MGGITGAAPSQGLNPRPTGAHNNLSPPISHAQSFLWRAQQEPPTLSFVPLLRVWRPLSHAWRTRVWVVAGVDRCWVGAGGSTPWWVLGGALGAVG